MARRSARSSPAESGLAPALEAEVRALSRRVLGAFVVERALAEAELAAAFVERFWAPVVGADGRVVRPGLAGGPLGWAVAEELRALLGAARAADRAAREALLAEAARGGGAWSARADHVIHELRAALRWVAEGEPGVAALLAKHPRRARSERARRAQLADLAGWAARWRAALEALPAFDGRLVDEAAALVARARAAQEARMVAGASAQLGRRNQLLRAARARVTAVRAAARYVFRAQPEVARLAGPR